MPHLSRQPGTILLYEHGEPSLLPAGIAPADLKSHLWQVWRNRRWQHGYDAEPGADAGGFQPFLRFDGQSVQARNHAGVIHFQGVTIYLLPKLFRLSGKTVSLPVRQAGFANPKPPADPANLLCSVFAHLDFYLSYCQHVRFPFRWQAAPTGTQQTLQTWIGLFASLTSKVLAEEPYQAYQTRTDQTAFMRGKLAVNEYIAEQISRGRWQILQTEQQPLTADNLFNRIVKHTARQLLHLASIENRLMLQAIEIQLDEVSEGVFSPDDCEAAHLNRLNEKHRQVLEMCRFFLAAATGSAGGQNDSNFTFLLPTERVFEDFVSGFIEKHFPEWQIQRQHPVKIAVDNQSKTIYAKPDIWLPKHNTIWDVKYKLLNMSGLPLQIPPADLYQMRAYAAACHTKNAHLLYASAIGSVSTRVCFESEGQPINVYAHALPVVLDGDGDTFSALTLRLQETLRKIAGT